MSGREKALLRKEPRHADENGGRGNPGGRGSSPRQPRGAVAEPEEAEALARRLARAEALLAFEGEIRRAADMTELRSLAVNESRRLLNYVQAFWVEFAGEGSWQARVMAATGLASVDRTALLIQMVERAARALARSGEGNGGKGERERAQSAGIRRGRLEALLDGDVLKEWPFREFLWLPITGPDDRVEAGLLLLRLPPWEEAAEVVGARLAEALAHARNALLPRRRWWQRVRARRVALALAVAGICALVLVPVPMMAVAPAEVVARDPVIVAASMDGVIREVLVAPGSQVRAGQVLAVYDDTELKARARLAARREAVAASRLASLRKAAFSDAKARAELAEAEAELRLARAERAHAEELLSRVRILAPVGGIVLLADREEWVRRPVRTGERILRLARPGEVALRVDLPVRDALALKPGDPVKVFLDADPLDARRARIRRVAHEAREVAGGLLAYRVDALFEPGEDRGLSIGFRGSASLRGEKVPLGLWLFRRPLAALRQMTGL
jgi:multidrug resistance efflux pump